MASIGDFSNQFTGSLDGNGYMVDGLYIDRLRDYVGLIGYSDGDVSNIGVVNADVTGANKVGGLVGRNSGTVKKSYATASVSGDNKVGGLIGYFDGGVVTNNYAAGSLSGGSEIIGSFDNYGSSYNHLYADTGSLGNPCCGNTGLSTSDMQGDSYHFAFKDDIVDKSAFTGVTGDYPELAWQSE